MNLPYYSRDNDYQNYPKDQYLNLYKPNDTIFNIHKNELQKYTVYDRIKFMNNIIGGENMSEDRILQAIGRIECRIGNLDKKIANLDKKVDEVSQDLKDFKEETRTNFVSMSKKVNATNEKLLDIDNKLEQKFEKSHEDIANLIDSVITSVDKHYMKVSNSN